MALISTARGRANSGRDGMILILLEGSERAYSLVFMVKYGPELVSTPLRYSL